MRRASLLAASAALLASCTLVAPSVPYGPGAVARDGDRFYFDLGCTMGGITEVELRDGDRTFWLLTSLSPGGVDISGFEIGEVPDGFEETVAFDPEWADQLDQPRAEAAEPDAFLAVELAPGVETTSHPGVRAGASVVPTMPEDGWHTQLDDSNETRSWESYQEDLVEGNASLFDGAGCTQPNPEPSF